MAVGQGVRGANVTYMAVAVKKSVIVYQVDRTEKRHRKVKVGSKHPKITWRSS